MKELSIDTTRCPGREVCGDPVCSTILEGSFYRRLAEFNQRGFISEEKYEEEEDLILLTIYRCTAQAIILKQH